MKYKIEKHGSIPAYLQLYSQLKSDIVNGFYGYGSKLPSKRIMADDTGTSIVTVEHAYCILCDEGYVESRERSGYYITYKSSKIFFCSPDQERINQEQRSDNTFNNFTRANDNTGAAGIMCDSDYAGVLKKDFPFSILAKTMRRVISEYGESLLIKSPNNGCPELRTAIASYLARNRGIIVGPEQVIVGSGAEYMYSLIVQFLGRNRIFAVEDPSYEKILSVYRANGVKCDRLKLMSEGISTSELRRTQATVLHVTPFRSYPSGITASPTKRAEYISWAKERNGYIVEDDFASEFTISTRTIDTLFSLDPLERVIYLNTFSQTIAPSIRVGYMILSENLLNKYKEKTGFYSCTVPVFEQYVLAEFINSGEFERHINRVRRKNRNKYQESNSKRK